MTREDFSFKKQSHGGLAARTFHIFPWRVYALLAACRVQHISNLVLPYLPYLQYIVGTIRDKETSGGGLRAEKRKITHQSGHLTSIAVITSSLSSLDLAEDTNLIAPAFSLSLCPASLQYSRSASALNAPHFNVANLRDSHTRLAT